jgi:hypothetical protein
MPSRSNITIWPNPAFDIVNIQYYGSSNNMTAVIMDELGRTISKSNINQGNNIVSLSKIPPGIYFVKVTGANIESYIKKIIKIGN